MSATSARSRGVPRPKTTFFNLRRVFIKDSPLFEYLVQKQPYIIQRTLKTHTVGKIVLAIHNLIAVFALFDPANPFVIHCNMELERALQVGAFHICQLPELVCKQLEPLAKMGFSTLLLPVPLPSWASPHSMAVKAHRHRLIQPLDPLLSYWVHPSLLSLLRPLMEPEDKQLLTLPYNLITRLFKQYLESHFLTLFDVRNLDIAHIEGTELGQLFQVKAIYKLQVPDFLRPLLIQFTNVRQETWPDFEDIFNAQTDQTEPKIESITIEPTLFIDTDANASLFDSTLDIKDEPDEPIFNEPCVEIEEFL